MKKFVAILAMVLCISLVLSGCVYSNGKVTLKANGSGVVVFEIGFSKELIEKTGQTTKEIFGKNSETYAIKVDGKEYIVEKFEDAFLRPEDMNLTTVGTVSGELGSIKLTALSNGFRLDVKLQDGFGPNMNAEHMMPSFDKISNSTLQGMTLKDLIAQDVDGLFLKVTFEMPYAVVKTSGGNSGVTISGNTITLDHMKMIKSGDSSWTFESTKDVTDISNSTITATPTASTVQVNGKSLSFDAYTIEGNNYFKLRDLAYTLSGTAARFEVSWDGAKNAISLTSGKDYTAVGGEMTGKGTRSKTPMPTSAKIYLDGKEVQFTAYTIDGNNYFKLRDIGKALDFWVDWDGANNRVIIDTTIVNSGLVYDENGNIIGGVKWDTNTSDIS